MDDSPRNESTAKFRQRVIDSLKGKRIIDVRLPNEDEPFDELEFSLDDGTRALLVITSSSPDDTWLPDGPWVIGWGINVSPE